MKHRKSREHRAIIIAVSLLALLGVVTVALDWGQVHQALAQVDWKLVPVALLFSALSYACLGYGFVVMSRLFGVTGSQRDLFEIGFVSFALSYLVATGGGVAGYSLRMLLIKRRGISVKEVLVASLFHSTLNHLFLFALVPIGLVFLLLNHPLASKGEAIGIGLAAGLLFVLVVFVAVVVFSEYFRAVVLRLVGKVLRRISHWDVEGQLEDFNLTLTRGVKAIRDHPLALVLPLVLVVGDWAFSIAVLGFCFDALGNPVGPEVLLPGFAIGLAVGLLSMIPGGLGAQEGSMAATYALLGIPFGQAVLAAILFRTLYFFIPFLGSLGFYWRLMRGEDKLAPGQ
ncbi:MAG: flippase-like domain-containing protein [Rubrobacter sp.]|nr:flippase-like domain-containing protein [Rubrobacter sp.]